MNDDERFDAELPPELGKWQRAGRFPVPHELSLRPDTDLWAIQIYSGRLVRRLGFRVELRTSYDDCLLKYRFLWGPSLSSRSNWYYIQELDLDRPNLQALETYLFDHLTETAHNHMQLARYDLCANPLGTEMAACGQ